MYILGSKGNRKEGMDFVEGYQNSSEEPFISRNVKGWRIDARCLMTLFISAAVMMLCLGVGGGEDLVEQGLGAVEGKLLI